MTTTAELLDLEVDHRSATFRFDLLSSDGIALGQVDVQADRPPQVVNNINRPIKRSMRGLRIPSAAYAEIDTLTERIAPVMVLSNGAEFPLGVFLFADAARYRRTDSLDSDSVLVDQSLILDQATSTSIGYSAGASVRDAVVEQLAAAGFLTVSVDSSARTFGGPVAWPAGTSRLAVLNELAGMMGAYSPYFDNGGIATVRLVPDLATATPDLIYGEDGRIYADTIVETDDLLEAPNRYIAISSDATEEPVVGVFDVPDDAPHSIANRGFAIASVRDVQGLENQAAAVDAARAAYAQDSSTFFWADFASAPDPRHDTFDIVAYRGVNYREQAWSLDLVEGAPMTHSLRRIYESGVVA